MKNVFILLLTLVSSFSLTAQYCTPVSMGTACISHVSLNTINNMTGICSATNYAQYSGTMLTQGATYVLTVHTTSNAIMGAWIDYDQSLTLDASEFMLVAQNDTLGILSFSVPFTSVIGQTLLRVRTRIGGNILGPTDACTTLGSGECEDYLVGVENLVTPTTAYEEKNTFYVYPNPAKERIQIISSASTSINTLFDITGRVILTSTSNTIPVAHLPKGSYILQHNQEKQLLVIQ
jgi:hypothetical protein